MTNKELYNRIESTTPRNAWSKGVKEQALELIETAEVKLTRENAKEELLNGASGWHDYSYGGCALVYDGDIAERYCTPSELKRNDNGRKNPNAREEWLDVQARALAQAYRLIINNLR